MLLFLLKGVLIACNRCVCNAANLLRVPDTSVRHSGAFVVKKDILTPRVVPSGR